MIASDWQPNPARGVFETLLVVGGAPVELEAHLHRLARSLNALYSKELPSGAEEELRQAAEGIRLGRLRFAVGPVEDDLRLDLLAGEVESEVVFPVRGMKLRTYSASGGLGPHKLVDRPPEIERPPPGKAGALLVDQGEVLEAGWANVFAVRGGTLFTPPLDGRILPGTTRAALLALASGAEIEFVESPLGSEDLYTADEAFLSNSIRGIEAVLELDGKPLPGCGPLSHRLAAALQGRWGLTNGWGAIQSPATVLKPDLLSH